METWQHQHLKHFDLQRQPFQKSEVLSIAGQSENQRAAFSELKRGLLEQKGSVLLTGPSGSGKSLLAAQLAAQLADDISCRIIHAKIPHAGMNSVQFYQLLAETFQVKNTFVSKGGFLVQVRQNMASNAGPDSRIVLIVDDAHRMGKDLLDGMRMLADIKVRNYRLINFFFIGRRRLTEILAGQTDQTLYKTIAVQARLEYLSNKDTADYLRECFRQAGARGAVFDVSAETEVFRISRGNLRLIDPICELSLLIAFANGRRQVSNRIVGESARLLGLPARQIDSAVFLETANYVIYEKKCELGVVAENSEDEEDALAAAQPLVAAEPTVVEPKRPSDGRTAVTTFFREAAADLELCCKKSRQSSILTHVGMSLIVLLFFGFCILHIIDGKQAGMQVPQPLVSDILSADQNPGVHVLMTANDQKGSGNAMADVAAEMQSARKIRVDNLSAVKPADIKFENENNNGRLAIKTEVIRFNDDPNEILPENDDLLFRIADHLVNNPASKITVRGYCDVVGARENNLNLSLFQSNIVKSYLVAKGISPDRIQALAFGRELPVAPDLFKEMGSPKRMVIIEWPASGRSHEQIDVKRNAGVQAPVSKRYTLP